MSLFPGPSNPIVYAQFVLQGRWKRMFIVAGVYAALVGGLMWLSTLASSPTPADMTAYLAVLSGLQVLNLFVFGSFRVESAVRGDVTSRIIESHRLMPASPLGAILGYIFGAPLQVTLLAVVNLALGLVICTVGGLSPGAWLAVNAVLFFLAIVILCIVMQFAFLFRGGFPLLLVGGLILISFAGSGGLDMIPSLRTLLFPIFSRASVFGQMFSSRSAGAPTPILVGYASAIAAQVIIAAVAIRVGMRRYLSSTIVGISMPLGMILLATWVALAIVGLTLPNDFGFGRSYDFDTGRAVAQTVSSLSTAMLLAMLPIASAARSARQMRLGGELSGRRAPARHTEIWTLLAVFGILGVLLYAVAFVARPSYRVSVHFVGGLLAPDFKRPKAILPTAVIVANFLITISCFFAHGYIRRRRPWIVVSLFVPIVWFGPLIADAISRAMMNNEADATALSAFSPPGAIAILWSGMSVDVLPGIIGQVLLTLIPFALLLLALRKWQGMVVAKTRGLI